MSNVIDFVFGYSDHLMPGGAIITAYCSNPDPNGPNCDGIYQQDTADFYRTVLHERMVRYRLAAVDQAKIALVNANRELQEAEFMYWLAFNPGKSWYDWALSKGV